MQFALNPEIEGLSQFYSNFLYDTIIVLIIGFIEVALRSGRLILDLRRWSCNLIMAIAVFFSTPIFRKLRVATSMAAIVSPMEQ